MQADNPIAAPPPMRGAKNTGMMMNVVAVVLAVAALAAALAIPGPAGPAGTAGTNGSNGTNGAAGPQGPAGNGTLMAHFLQLGTVTLGSGCTNSSAAVTITVPKAGNVTVTASMTFEVTHTSGTIDVISYYVSTSRFGGCSDTAGFAVVPASEPTDTYFLTGAVALSSPVAAAGAYTYTVAAATGGTANIYFASGYVVYFSS